MQKMKKGKKGYSVKPPVSYMDSPGEQRVEPIFSIKNYVVLGVGLIVLAVGYYFLAQPSNDPGKLASEGFLSLNVAPILLVVAYLIIIPVALLFKRSKKTETKN